ncbi:response regulator [Zavarzinella formosa]|uniref:response regulator n=1 Tax=Zavarzinella formosa TaxID=360055 RepID=UPI0002EC4A90|nr:response regulator [Zavarzinella formosa]
MNNPDKPVVLIVDDQEANRYSTGRILREAGYVIQEAQNGQQGIALSDMMPDVILLDVNLPDIDGFRVCREIRSHPKTARIPIIHVSATFVSEYDRAHGLDEGADGYLTRPVEPRVLVATVRAMLRARRAEETVRQRERELQALADNTPDILSRFDREFRHTFVNAAVEKATGRPVADFLGKTNRELGMPAEQCDLWDYSLANVFRTGKPLEIEFSFQTPDGIRFYSARLVPEFNAAGTVEHILGVTRDATDKHRAETALRESESRFRTMANSISQLAWVARPDGYIFWYNNRWLDYTGATLEQMIAGGWEAVIDPAESDQVTAKIRDHFRSGESWEDMFRLRRHDGVYRWFLSRMQPVRDENGKIELWFGTNTDIEDLRVAEQERQKFVSLVESSTDFIATYDLAGKPLYVNHAGLRMIGLDDLESAGRIRPEELFQPDDHRQLLEKILPSLLADGQAEIETQVRHLKTGESLWMNCKAFAHKDASGKTTAYSTVCREITERKQLETNLRQIASDLSEANRRQFQFLATLAHELRNPLAPIRTGLELIRMSDNLSGKVEATRAMMERQTQHMVRLIDDLLDLSRITQGKLQIRKRQIELAEIIRNAIESIRPFIDKAGHTLETSLPRESLFLDADPNRLAQVFSNILSNAAKYTPDGGRISLAVHADGPEVVIRVRDNGLGIPFEMQQRIFEMFVQVDRPDEAEYSGLGIGLTLVRQILQMHSGSIQVHSEGAGLGTEFTVRLPILPEESLSSAPAVEKKPVAPTAVHRILVVDDNKDAADSLGMILGILGHEVRLAGDGIEAIRAAEEFRPDVILMDLGMPRLDGYEAARRIRDQSWSQGMTLVALTGWGQDADKVRTKTAGFDHHLTKPAEPALIKELLAKIR